MKKLVIGFTLAVGLWACSGLQPVQNIPPRSLTLADGITMQEAILRGGAKKGWAMYQKQDGLILGNLSVRGHEVNVQIPYTDNSYAISYDSSSNMLYQEKKNRIHRKYNQWVRNLDLEIRRAAAGTEAAAH